MPKNRIGRINEEIQKELSALIRTLKDPRVQTIISITHVETTKDLRYAKIFVSVLDKERTKDALKGLKSAGGFLRHEIGARLLLRCTPELLFEEDDAIEHGAHIFDLISKLNIKGDEPNDEQ